MIVRCHPVAGPPRYAFRRVVGFALLAASIGASTIPASAALPSAALSSATVPARDESRVVVHLRAFGDEKAADVSARLRDPAMAAVMRRYGLTAAGPLAPSGRAIGERRRRGADTASARAARARLETSFVLRASRAVDVDAALEALRALPGVEAAEPDFLAFGASARVVPVPADDPDFPVYQWGFQNTGDQVTEPENLPRRVGADIDAAGAWSVTTGDARVVVAVLDTGVRTDHAEFAGRIWVNEGEIAGNGVDDDGNGYVDDVNGYNFAYANGNPYDDGGHGTACAGILGATGNNGIHVAGLDWKCRLMPVKVLSSAGVGSLSGIAQAIVYAADNGADVISMSLGGYGLSSFLQDACLYAHDRGVVLVAAMMNDDSSQPSYPAAFDRSVIAVGGSDPADQRCTPEVSGYGSNYGAHIDVVAPGVSIPVLVPGLPTGVALGAGTSFSTPAVAGLASLLLAAHPELSSDQVRDLIRYSAADQVGRPSEDTPGFDLYHGWGRIDAGRALARAATERFPVMTAPAAVRGAEGAPLSFEIAVSDADGDPIESLGPDAGGLPPGATFTASADKRAGTFAWTPGYLQSGAYTVRIVATDPFEAAATTAIDVLDVPDPPFVTVPSFLQGDEGLSLSAEIAATDPDGDPLVSLTSGPLPEGATFAVEPGNARGLFAWTPGHAQAGDYVVGFQVESLDPAGPLGGPLLEHGSAAMRVRIREGPDQPPAIAAPDRVETAEGDSIAIAVSVADADGDPIVALAASPLPPGATFAAEPGNAAGTLAWAPGHQQAGTYEIALSASSAHRATGLSDPIVTDVTASLTIVVADTPRPPVASPGGPYEGVIGVPIAFDGTASSDPDGTPLTSYRWDFGDGVLGSGPSPAHAYAAGGLYDVALTVGDGKLEASAATTAKVRDLFAARAFPDPGDRVVRLLSGKPTIAIRVEPVAGSFATDAVDLGAATLASPGTGDVESVIAVAGKSIAATDSDRNGVAEIAIAFSKESLRRLFARLPAGRHRVTAALEAPLASGGRLHADVALEVVAAGGAVAAAVAPNPLRHVGALTVRAASGGAVRVRIFDASGRLVRAIAATTAGAGPGSSAAGPMGEYADVPIDGRDDAGRALRSGIYFYRVESGAGIASGRFVLVR